MTDLPRLILVTLSLCLLGLAGGFAAKALGLPLPFMLGSLIFSAAIAIFAPNHLPEEYKFPSGFRAVFIAMIGCAIGAQIDMEVIRALPGAIYSFALLTLFVPAAQAANYWIFRRVGGYDPATAFYAGAPGGLIESIVLGEEAGADARLLTAQQFLRIILVVTLLPIGLSLWYGHPVGSAAGTGLSGANVGLDHLPQLAIVALIGGFLGTKLKIPAGQLMGPLLAAGVVTLAGWTVIEVPNWLVSGSQVVIGTALGIRFTGIRARVLLRAAGLGILSVGAMLGIGAAMAVLLTRVSDEHFDVLLISFAPGGVTEMALVALSLSANPAFVTLHHLYRIILTVIALTVARPWFRKPPEVRPPPSPQD